MESRNYAWNEAGTDASLVGNTNAVSNLCTNPVDVAHQRISARDDAWHFLDRQSCLACHRLGGARTGFYASFRHTTTPRALKVKPKQSDFGIEEAQVVSAGNPFRLVLFYRLAKLGQGRMSFVGAPHLDNEAIQLLRRWIQQMSPAGPQTVSSGAVSSGAVQNERSRID